MTTHPRPARVDLGDGDSLILFRTDDYHTTVRFHSTNPNTQLAGAVMATDALRAALDEVAPAESVDYADGGVTAAAIEKEAGACCGPQDETVTFWHERWHEVIDRAEKAEKNASHAAVVAKGWMHTADSWQATAEEWEDRAAQPRPLMPADITLHSANSASWVRVRVEHPALGVIEEGIPLPTASAPNVVTDEMVERAKRAYVTRRYKDGEIGRVTPELRNAIHDALTAALTPEPPQRPDGAEKIEAAIRQVTPSHPEDRYADLADKLAERGVRVTGGES